MARTITLVATSVMVLAPTTIVKTKPFSNSSAACITRTDAIGQGSGAAWRAQQRLRPSTPSPRHGLHPPQTNSAHIILERYACPPPSRQRRHPPPPPAPRRYRRTPRPPPSTSPRPSSRSTASAGRSLLVGGGRNATAFGGIIWTPSLATRRSTVGSGSTRSATTSAARTRPRVMRLRAGLPAGGRPLRLDADATQWRVEAVVKQRGDEVVHAFANSLAWWVTVSGPVTGIART